jgi:hypothetical protein
VVKHARALGADCVIGNWDNFIMGKPSHLEWEHKQ